jgi:inositol-hexakisphosphate kinase
MGTVVDNKHIHHYHFPPPPSSSGNLTAIRSPRLYAPDQSDPVDGLNTAKPSFCRSHSHTSNLWRRRSVTYVSDFDPPAPQKSPSNPSPILMPRMREPRPLTLPPKSSLSSLHSKISRPLSPRSSSDSSTSSSPLANDHPLQPSSASGIGRKVAATLQLFKETSSVPPEDVSSQEPETPETSVESRRVRSSSKLDEASQPQFEFLMLSEWPDREAAVRRERSSTNNAKARESNSTELDPVSPQGKENGKEKKPSIRDNVMSDLSQWRRDMSARQDDGRGRQQERADDDDDDFAVDTDAELDPSVPNGGSNQDSLPLTSLSRTRPRAYPSPSRSPITRLTPASLPPISTVSTSLTFQNNLPNIKAMTSEFASSLTPKTSSTSSISRAPYHSALPFEPISLSPTLSSDDDWETASSSTSSANSFPSSPLQTPHAPSFLHTSNDDNDYVTQPNLVPSRADREAPLTVLRDSKKDDDYMDLADDFSQEYLPHVPLRPFRNQVGGHSAIYKFTKRAVCKVRSMYFVSSSGLTSFV